MKNNLRLRKMSEEIGLDKITKIVELTEKDVFRKEIAQQVKVSPSTVFKYQKKLHLV